MQLLAQAGGGARSATRLSSSSTAVSVCPTSSCSSWAIRCRSRLLRGQRPGGARGPLGLQPVEHRVERRDQRRRSRRSGDRRAGPGRSRSTVAMALLEPLQRREPEAQHERVGAEHPPARRAGRVPRPASTGVDTVTGPSSNAPSPTTSTAALSKKIRQNRDTAYRLHRPVSLRHPPACALPGPRRHP